MKKMLLSVSLLLALSFIFYGLILAQGSGEKTAAVGASGTALWNHLKEVNYAKNWQMWPGKTALYQGTEPHGALLTTYVNETAYMAIKEKKGMLPVGSIIAKENYSPDKQYMALTVMYKIEGYNPQAGDWFWAKYTPEGKIEAEGKVDMCIQCHGQKKDNDYITTESLK